MSRTKAHLHSVNESYFQHMQHALSFTLAMFHGAWCCLVHAFFPFLFERRGSAIVQELHERMVVNRTRLSAESRASDRAHDTAEFAVIDQD